MAVNNRGQAALVGFMVFAFILVAALILANPLKEIINEQRDATHLDCSNTSISVGTKAVCLVVDLTMVYFIGVVIVGGASWLILRRVFGEGG